MADKKAKCIRVAYGIEVTIGPNGTMRMGDMPPGNTITNMTGNATEGSATIHVGPPPNNNAGTNEKSYKFGFSAGYDDYNHCFDSDVDAQDCSPPENNDASIICSNPNNNVTNSTACIDGYANGWKHWCMSDTKDCATMTTQGTLPGLLYPTTR